MYFDALTLAAVADELRATVLGGRIQRVVLPSQLSVALEVYANHRRFHLLLSAHPRFARAQLIATKPSRGVETQTPLLLLLRKYALRGFLVAVEQPDLERVLVLSIAKRLPKRNTDAPEPEPADEDERDDDLDAPAPMGGDEDVLRCELILEAMDQRSNLVLVGDDNVIHGAARVVTPRMSRRPVQPHEPYEFPPGQQKRDPRHITGAGVHALLSGPAGEPRAGQDLARALVGAYRGLSPLAAREAVFRALGAPAVALAEDLPYERVAEAVRALLAAPPAPSLVPGDEAPAAFAPYVLGHMPGWRPSPSIGAALEAFYTPREQLTAHSQRRAALRQRLLGAHERLEKQRSSLAGELERARDLERLRWEGEMIFAFLHTLAPRQSELEVEGRLIALDPRKSPVACAQERFRAYDKAKGALAGVPERLREVEARLAGLDETVALLDLAEGYEQIEAIAREAADEGYLTVGGARKPKPARPMPPLRVESSDGLPIYVGRSAGQNQQVTFRIGAPDDLWLHARGVPGAHVIVKSAGREVPERTLMEAAALAAYYSARRGDAGVDVELARRSLVRRVRGGPAGLVTYSAERALRVAPRPPW